MMILFQAGVRAGLGPLAWIGRISYSLYLIHQRIGVTLIGHLKAAHHLSDAVAISATVAAAIALAALMFYGIEQPAKTLVLQAWATFRPLRSGEPVPVPAP